MHIKPNLAWLKELTSYSTRPPIGELASVIEGSLNDFRNGAHRGHLLPYTIECLYMQGFLGICRDQYYASTGPETLGKIGQLLESVAEVQDRFEHVRHTISKHIQLWVQPDPHFGNICHPRGQAIIPSNQEQTRYFVFGFVASECGNCNGYHLDFTSLNRHGFDSPEQAFEHVDRKLVQTVVRAHNTESYNLGATVLPIVGDKYVAKLQGR